MVIVIEKRGKNVCFFPKNTHKCFCKLWLEIDVQGKTDVIDTEDEMCYHNWYTFVLDFSRYKDGEYTYKLYGDGELIGQGLLQIGKYEIEAKSFKTKPKIKEYNA